MDLVVRPVIMREALNSEPNSGVLPFGHTTQLHIFIDPDLLQFGGVKDFVWAAAGTWDDNFAIAPSDLVRISSGPVIDLKRS